VFTKYDIFSQKCTKVSSAISTENVVFGAYSCDPTGDLFWGRPGRDGFLKTQCYGQFGELIDW